MKITQLKDMMKWLKNGKKCKMAYINKDGKNGYIKRIGTESSME